MALDGSRFRLGDLVWAKVKSHPWWPGQIFDPALASALARKSRRETHVLVAFFGDSTFGWFPESELIPFEPNFKQKSLQTSAPNFLEAVEDAIEEIGRRVELGLMCPCNISIEMEGRRQKGRGLNLDRQLREARKAFKPSKMIAFVKDLACSPLAPPRDLLWRSKAEAQAQAFRVAAFCARDSEYEGCFRTLPEGGDFTPIDQAGTQGLEDCSEEMAFQATFPGKVDAEGENCKVLLDMDREGEVFPEDSRMKKGGMDLHKASDKVNLYTTCTIPNGTENPKRSREEEKSPESSDSPPPQFKKRMKGTSSNWKENITKNDETDGKCKTRPEYFQDPSSESFDAPVSGMNNGESAKLQFKPKKSKGFKRLVKKGLKPVHVESKRPSNADLNVEMESNGIGHLQPDDRMMDSNEMGKKRKSKLQSKRDFDSARPPKQRVRPSKTPDTINLGSHITADFLDDKIDLPGVSEEQRIADAVSQSREHAETYCSVPSEGNSDVGLHLQGKDLLLKHEEDNCVGKIQASSNGHDDSGKICLPKKKCADVSLSGLSQHQKSGSLETSHVGKERTYLSDDSGSPPREYGESLTVSCDKCSLQSAEVSGQTGKGYCVNSYGVVKDMNPEKMFHKVKTSKSSASENRCSSRRQGIPNLDCPQTTSEGKKKRLKTISSAKAPEHGTRGVHGAPDVSVHSSMTVKSATTAVNRASDMDDNAPTQQKFKDILRFTELLECLRSLAADPLGERKEQVFCDVLKAFTNFRREGPQLDSYIHPLHGQEGQKSVSAPSAAAIVRVCQEGQQVTNVTQNYGDDSNAVERDEHGAAIIETSTQLCELNASTADIVKPDINGSQKIKLDGPNQARTAIVGQCSQVEPCRTDNCGADIFGGQEVKSDCQGGASYHRVNGLVKNLKKQAPSSVSRKVSAVTSSRSPLETDNPVHVSRDALRSLDSVTPYSSKPGSEAVRTPHTAKVIKASQAQGTALLIRFPQGFALPSEAQLRATFIRFGQLDLSGTRIYHNSGCAQVVYQHAHDAESAFKFVKENHVFGQAPVSFKLRQFSQMRDMGMTQISLNSKEGKPVKNEEGLTLSCVFKEDMHAVQDQGTLCSRNHTVNDDHLQVDSRSPTALKSCLKKTDDSMSSNAKNGARVTFQLSCGVNPQPMPSTNNSRNNLVMHQVVVKSGCEMLSGISNDQQSHAGSSPSVQYSCSGPRPSSLGSPISTDISHQMLTLLHQVSALVGTSGIVL